MESAVCLNRKFHRLIQVNMKLVAFLLKMDAIAGRANDNFLKLIMDRNRNIQLLLLIHDHRNIIEGIGPVYRALRSVAGQ